MSVSTVPPLVDTVARASGPLALLSFVGVLATLALFGSDEQAMTSSPLALAAVVAGLLALVALACAVFSFATRLGDAPTWTGGAVLAALVGTLLAAGGQWTLLFVVPGLAEVAPEIASNGLPSVSIGYVVSFLVLAAGWGALAVAARRAGLVSRATSAFMVVGALVCIAPLPSRWFVLGLVVTVALSRMRPLSRTAAVTPMAGSAAT